MAIALGTDADLPELLALLKQSKLPSAGLDRHISSTLVARVDGNIVGCAAVEVYGQAGLLRSVAVDAGRRGEGLGARLTKAALELARKKGVRNIYLLTTTASHFFPRFGFTVIPRSELDPALEQSEELRGACPASALAMHTAIHA